MNNKSKNFSNVLSYDIEPEGSGLLCYSASWGNGRYVEWEDYEALLNAHRSLLEKISEVVGDHIFEE